MKTVFLTGGTGSFGQGFVKTLLGDPDIDMIRVFSRDEHKQSKMRQWAGDKVSFYIGDVRDAERLRRAMDGCHWVVHAAALKQAPLGEIEPWEFIQTNIQGSKNVIEAALDCNVEKALLISSDKAVEPINLYGATKLCAERLFLQADRMRAPRRTRFACTRYGNVAGTAGSIVPVLMSLESSRQSPVYDPEATRFWINLKDANAFVLESLKDMEGGDIFWPELKSARVVDIVEAIRPGKPVAILGPRGCDKRHETLHYNPMSGFRYSSDNNDFMTIEEIRQDVFGYPTGSAGFMVPRLEIYP